MTVWAATRLLHHKAATRAISDARSILVFEELGERKKGGFRRAIRRRESGQQTAGKQADGF